MGLARKILNLFIAICLAVLPWVSPGAALAYTYDMAPVSHPSTAHCHQENTVQTADRPQVLSADDSSRDEWGCNDCCPASGGCGHGCACTPCSAIAPSHHGLNQGCDTPRGYEHDILVYSHVAPPPVPPPITLPTRPLYSQE